MLYTLFRLCFVLMLLCLPTTVSAVEQVETDKWTFSIFAGQGQIENPVVNLKDIDTNVFPSISYYGERFFWEGTTLGYSLLESDDVIVDLVGLLNEDGLFHHFEEQEDLTVIDALGFNPSRFPIDGGEVFKPVERDISYLGGISVSVFNDYFETRLGYFHDLTAVHHGYEIHFSLGRGIETKWFNIYFEAGKVIKSDDLVRYYYQFQDKELAFLGGIKDFYTGGQSHNHYYKVELDVPLTDYLSLTGFFKHTHLGNNISKSLLVEDNNYQTSFIGVRYSF